MWIAATSAAAAAVAAAAAADVTGNVYQCRAVHRHQSVTVTKTHFRLETHLRDASANY